MKLDRAFVDTRLSSFVPFLILAASFSVFSLAGCKQEQKAAPPPPEVEVVTVVQKDVPIYSEFVGTADGYVNATIRAQVAGYLIKQDYKEGDLVKKGQVLFEIDPRTFQAALEQAKGQLAAQQARWDTAKANLKRIKPLAEQNAVSQKDLDDATGTEQAAHAAVFAAQATVDKAALDLGFTKVTSLIDGIAAIATAQIGDLVNPSTLLTTVSQVDPIKAYFPLSEVEYLQIAGAFSRSGRMHLWNGCTLALVLADGSVYPETGSFLAADREISAKTGTIRISATFPNRQLTLRPGQYGRVRADTNVRADALLVPQRAVTELQGATQVRVIGADDRVVTRTIAVGERVGSRWIVERGLQPGDRVVVTGPPTRDGALARPAPWVPNGAGH